MTHAKISNETNITHKESKFPFVSRIEFIHSKLSNFLLMYPWLLTDTSAGPASASFRSGLPRPVLPALLGKVRDASVMHRRQPPTARRVIPESAFLRAYCQSIAAELTEIDEVVGVEVGTSEFGSRKLNLGRRGKVGGYS